MTRNGESADKPGVEAVDRALRLLDCLGGVEGDAGGGAMPLVDLARASGLNKSTILRLATTLARRGYVVREDGGRWRLGPAVWRLAARYRGRFPAVDLIRPELARLAQASGESASFYVREGAMRLCLYRENSSRALRHHLVEGALLPLEGGAAARVIRAFTDHVAEPDAGAAAPPRALDHAVSVGERDPDLAAVAVALIGGDGRFLGALSVSGPCARFDAAARAAALEALRAATRRLGERLAETAPT